MAKVFDKGILSEKVADSIKEMILHNKLNPGDKLDNELVLSEKLNVSRSTVREAIKILESMNILVVRRGVGTFVADKPGLTKDPLGMSFMDQENVLRSLFEIRHIIEPQMAALAAKRATKEDIAKLTEFFYALKSDMENGVDHSINDVAFHDRIATCCKNPIIDRIVPTINEGILAGYINTKDDPDGLQTVLNHHKSILDAIVMGDEKAAYEAMEEHVNYGILQVNKKYGETK